MSQNDLDVFTIRGLLGILRILERRIENTKGFSEQAKNLIGSHKDRIDKMMLDIRLAPLRPGDAEANYDKIDTWFADGFCNLILYLEKRLKHSAEMDVFTEAKLKSYITKLNEIIKAFDDKERTSISDSSSITCDG
jgi:hypothetical protein